MVDVLGGAGAFNVTAIQQGASQTAQGASTVGFYALIGLLLGALMFLYFYKRSFNVRVTILDNRNGRVQRKVGFLGKITQTRPGEFRFRLWAAKSNKLRYMEEGLKPEDITDEIVKNKIRKSVVFTFDEEGVLVPIREMLVVMERPKMDEKNNIIRDENGAPVLEMIPRIQAVVRQADLALFYKELDKSHELYDAKSFMDKYGWVILCIMMFLILCAFCYVAFKFSDAATTALQISADQTRMIQALVQLNAHNATVAGPAII